MSLVRYIVEELITTARLRSDFIISVVNNIIETDDEIKTQDKEVPLTVNLIYLETTKNTDDN